MANILCFGDSNTWGTQPLKNDRYDNNQRWTGILQTLLTDKHTLIEEGQPHRTLVQNAPFDGDKSGIKYLKSLLTLHSPELVIILLGTNDLKHRYQLSSDNISQSLAVLIKQTLGFSLPKTNRGTAVIIICPPAIFEVGDYAKMYQGGAEKSQQLAKLYQQCALELNCGFFDAGSIITSSVEDGIHWQVEQHQCLANALIPVIDTLIK